jgi:hypothetical protein
MTEKKLAKAQLSYQPNEYPFVLGNTNDIYERAPYHEVIKTCRFFYENDTIAGTVINRMVYISNTAIANKHRGGTKETKAFYDAIARIITPKLKTIPLTYMLDGLAIPEYRTRKVMGNRLDQELGRKRYTVPAAIWVRDNAHIELKKSPLGGERVIFMRISNEDRNFIMNEGKPDRVQEYRDLVALYPEYVAAVKAGQRKFILQDAYPIYRKLTTYNDYPIPFLKNSLGALQYRRKLKQMDRITSDRVINAIRHISVGNNDYPADDDDIEATKQAVDKQTNQETLLNVYTNHTVVIQWVIPDMSHLLDEGKYSEANGDVFMGMGFPRLWAVGENAKSNTSDNKLASVGPLATLEDMRSEIIEWIKTLYADLAEANGFLSYPEPYYKPISTADVQDLLQYANNFIKAGAISKNLVAGIYGSTYADEKYSMDREEVGVENNVPELSNDNEDRREIQE